MLLDAGLSPERFGQHGGGIVIAITREIANGDFRIGDSTLNQPLDVACMHRHRRNLPAYAAVPAM
jgi:hypothetical protein